MSQMTPREIVNVLDNHIIGQDKAKRAVAIALRNRWRRMQLDGNMREEITPKNILMIGPTGVGKTEIARRLARLAGAPFIKVEATKFTEVGYVGKDVESIIRDLVDSAINMIRDDEFDKVEAQAEDAAEERILDAIVPPPRTDFEGESKKKTDSAARQLFRKKLREGELDDQEVELELSTPQLGVEIMAPPGMEEMTSQLQSLFQNLSSTKSKRRKISVQDGLKILHDEEASKLVNEEDIRSLAITQVEENGIVFLDEIDKVAGRSSSGHSPDISREGVQRDILPLIEGCTVSTRYGMVRTDHILFIASGAFHLNRPSDLIPELQGRLPIRVELNPLTIADFKRILTEPDASLTEQYQALLSTEGLDIDFTECAIDRLAQIAWEVNERVENIGARRLHTILERLLEHVSYECTECKEKVLTIDEAYVDEQLADLAKNEDLSRFIL